MLAREVIQEVGESLGLCDQAVLLRRINRAVELLANKDLFDPLIGYLNFNVSEGNFIALPREVRTVLAVNINNSPAISRSRFYEFDLNSNGTEVGDTLDFAWNDRNNVCVQDEKQLPGHLHYRPYGSSDNGKLCTVEGKDSEGRDIREVLVGHATAPVSGTLVFHEILRIVREATNSECFLYSEGNLIGQYYADELAPVYRSIKLSKAVASVRVMFRREPIKITTLDSYIPLNSPMAIIQAAKAVGHLVNGEDDLADLCMARAEKFIKEDQATREEGDKMATSGQTPGTIGFGLTHSEGITVADVYDVAAEIFGKVGRSVLLKKITQACQVLLGKAHWDSLLGVVDIWPVSHAQDINHFGHVGHSIYALPRFIGTPLKINLCGNPAMPRNRWFDFHLNGLGERAHSTCGMWDDLEPSPLCNMFQREVGTGRIIGKRFIAICVNSLDEGKSVRIFGRELMANGETADVWRGGQEGWLCPCVSSPQDPGANPPIWVQVDRIEREETRDFVRLRQLIITPVSGTPGSPAAENTTITSGFPMTFTTWDGEGEVTAYGVINYGGSTITLYGDPGHTVIVGGSTSFPSDNKSRIEVPEDLAFIIQVNVWDGTVAGSLSFNGTMGVSESNDWEAIKDEINAGLPFTVLATVVDGQLILEAKVTGITLEVTGADGYDEYDYPARVATPITLTINGVTLVNGIVTRPADHSVTNFTIHRSYTAAIPEIPASSNYAVGEHYGFWYPDEVAPMYARIRIPKGNLGRIRILYRKRFQHLKSLFDFIPLRSSLAVENMLRALKALELGLVEQAEPLELKAVQYLSEDRIKEGQSEMGGLEFDVSTSPGGFENIN